MQYSFWACLAVFGKIKWKRTVQYCYAVKEKFSFVAGKEVGLEGNATDSKWSCFVTRGQDRTTACRSFGSGATVQRLGAVLTYLLTHSMEQSPS